MKFILLLLLCLPQLASAQVSKVQNEISVSYGFFSGQEFNHTTLIGGGSGGTFINNSTNNTFITFRHFFTPHSAISLAAGLNTFSGNNTDEDGYVTYDFEYKYTTVAAEYLYNYVNLKYFRCYTYVGAGCSFVTKIITSYSHYPQLTEATVGHVAAFNMQYAPVGISAGGQLAAFFEIGFGYKGLLNCGLSYRL